MITYQEDTFEGVKSSILEMSTAHWEEVEDFQDEIKLEPDLESYLRLYETGMLKIISMRDSGVVVGYILMFITHNLHHKSIKIAMADMFYVQKKYRKGYVAIKMFKFAEKIMKENNVDMMMLSHKFKHDKGSLFQFLGFKPAEISYLKLI